jgi:hypothetical protein
MVDSIPGVTVSKRAKEDTMRIAEVERPGLAVRAFYDIGRRLFGKVPTPERIMAHRVPLMLGLGGLWGSIECFGRLDAPFRALLQLHVATLYDAAY